MSIVAKPDRKQHWAAKGFSLDPDHGLMLTRARAREFLASGLPERITKRNRQWGRIADRTVTAWVTEGCVHLQGARLTQLTRKLDVGKGGPVAWHPLSELRRIKRSLVEAITGVHANGRLTPTAAQRRGLATRATVSKWRRSGALRGELVSNVRAGPRRTAHRHAYSVKDLDALRRRRELRNMGLYPGDRINLREAAPIVGVTMRYLRRLVEWADVTTTEKLDPETRKPPDRGKRELTILRSGAEWLAERRRQELEDGRRLSSRYKTLAEIETELKPESALNRIWLGTRLAELKKADPTLAVRAARIVDGRRRRPWRYDTKRLYALLKEQPTAPRPLKSIVAPSVCRESDAECLNPEHQLILNEIHGIPARVWEHAQSRAVAPTPAEQYVTLDKMAAIVSKSKKTLERECNKAGSTMPPPDVEGGGGRPHEWKWSRIRPWLEEKYARKLPVSFPR